MFPLKFALIYILTVVVICDPTVYFEEHFSDGDAWTGRWINSEHKNDIGQFKLAHGKFYSDEKEDIGVQTSQDARFYALSAKYDKFSNKDKTVVIQFSVKHDQDIDCGGGYVKLFPSTLDQTAMHGESPYNIMFGPDICGPGTKKVHVIFNYKGKNLLIKKDIRCKDDVLTHVYTLTLKPDNTYNVKIDNKIEKAGTLEEDWDFLEPKQIKDPKESKPNDWDDKEYIDDPEDTKPEDFDKAETIPDTDAEKPEDWDDEMDGEWEPPMMDNPDYQGEWTPKQIKNPNYQGNWKHPHIANPDYVADENLYSFDDFGNIGLDLWQVKSGSIFDNILICDDEEHASEVAQAIVDSRDGEKKMKEDNEEEERKREEEERKQREEEEGVEEENDEDNDEEFDEDLDEDFEAEDADAEEAHDEL